MQEQLKEKIEKINKWKKKLFFKNKCKTSLKENTYASILTKCPGMKATKCT